MLSENLNENENNDIKNLNDSEDIEYMIEDSEINIEETCIDDLAAEESSREEGEEEKKEEKVESKHKIKGKHSLGYDSIFKGKKKDEDSDDEFSQDFLIPQQESFDFDVSSSYHDDTKDPEEYVRQKELREEIYKIIVEKTDINIKNSRRKPGRIDFNKYYQILVENLDTSRYSFSEIFVELAFYFSDNIYNMFRLLDTKWGGKIIKELAKKRNIKYDIENMNFL